MKAIGQLRLVVAVVAAAGCRSEPAGTRVPDAGAGPQGPSYAASVPPNNSPPSPVIPPPPDSATGAGGTGGLATNLPVTGCGPDDPIYPMGWPADDAVPRAAGDACDRSAWAIVASATCADMTACLGDDPAAVGPAAALDGNPATRYRSGRAQGSGEPETLTVTFPSPVLVDGVTVVSAGGEGPAVLEVLFQPPGGPLQRFQPPVTLGGADRLFISFPPTVVAALQLKQEGSKAAWWSINELSVNDCAAPPAAGAGPPRSLPLVVDSFYVASGFMGEGGTGAVRALPCPADHLPPSAQGQCHGFAYSPAPGLPETMSWAGVAWQFPAFNWGAVPGLDIAPGASRVTFCAWGAQGDEIVDFFAGLTAPVDEVSVRLAFVHLAATPRRYALDLRGATYGKGVISGFGWTINGANVARPPATFFVTDIAWR